MRAALIALAAAGMLAAGCARSTDPPGGPAGSAGIPGGAAGEATSAPAATPTAGTSAATASTTAPTPRPPETAGGRCRTGELAGSLRGGDPAAGNRYATLVLTNTSHRTCTLYGYGGIQLARANGSPVPTVQRRDPNHPQSLIRLAPGARASSALHWAVVSGTGEPVSGPCEPVASVLLVIPPDERTQLAVPWRFGQVCGHGAIDQWAYAPGIVVR